MRLNAKLVIYSIIVLLVTVFVYFSFFLKNSQSIDKFVGQNLAILQINEGWGECPKPGECQRESVLYGSGKFTVKTKSEITKYVSAEKLAAIVGIIQNSTLMTEGCHEQTIFVYDVSYRISVGGKTIFLKNPDCKDIVDIRALLLRNEVSSDWGS